MTYTVKQVAKLVGISVRTLHWYDEIGLVKPAYYGSNGWRYYKDVQLETLKQLLFFKSLGFNLSEIQRLLERDSEERVRLLNARKHILKENLDRINTLIGTIDETLSKESEPLAEKSEDDS